MTATTETPTTEITYRSARVTKELFRKMISVVEIDEIVEIKKADKLELAMVGGWQVLVEKGKYTQGEKVLYLEIDSMVPLSHPDFAFLLNRKEIVYDVDGVLYGRVKTLKMRGEIFQGLIVQIPEGVEEPDLESYGVMKFGSPEDFAPRSGMDAILAGSRKNLHWTVRLGIWIAGPALPSNLRPFPTFLTKSEQLRVQNIGNLYARAVRDGVEFERTLKVNGTSLTAFAQFENCTCCLEGKHIETGTCQRNNLIDMETIPLTWEQSIRRYIANNIFKNRRVFSLNIPHPKDLSNDAPDYYREPGFSFKKLAWGLRNCNPKFQWQKVPFQRAVKAEDNVYTNYTTQTGMIEKLKAWAALNGDSIAVQGELCGPGVDYNSENLESQRFFVYAVYVNGRKVTPEVARRIAVHELNLDYVPIVSFATKLPDSIKDVLALADGPGYWDRSIAREGDVYKAVDGSLEFKVISNKWLLGEK